MRSSSKNSSKNINVALSTRRKLVYLSPVSVGNLMGVLASKDDKGKERIKLRCQKVEKMLFTINGACEHLAVSRSTLYRLIRDGKLTPVYIKGATRISNSSLKSLAGEIHG